MRITRFDWDAGNIEHIARHNISPEEVEEVFRKRHIIKGTRDDRYIALGRSEEGRYLFIVFIRKGTELRVITARDMDDRERRYFKRKGGVQ